MPQTSVLPFQHFLAPVQTGPSSPSNTVNLNSGSHHSLVGISVSGGHQNLFASSPFDDDRFHHPRHSILMGHQPANSVGTASHHPSSPTTSSSTHHHHSNNNNSGHHLDSSSPATPRTYQANNMNPHAVDSSNVGNHRWDPSPSALDEVSRGGGPPPPSSSSPTSHYSASQQSAFTLPPIVPNPMGTPRTNGMNPMMNANGPMSAGSEWDSGAPHYAAAAQWGAYSSSTGAYYFLVFRLVPMMGGQ